MGEDQVTVAQHTNVVSKTNNGTTNHMVEQPLVEMGCKDKHEAVHCKLTSSDGNDYGVISLRGVIIMLQRPFKSRISQVNPKAGADWIGKPVPLTQMGICGSASTPNVFRRLDWPYNNASMQTLTDYNNNAQYMAQSANAIYQADPSLFGIR